MTHDATELIEQASATHHQARQHVREAADWFHEREGSFVERDSAISHFEEAFGVSRQVANTIVSELVGDLVDPVTQIRADGVKYVGIVEYNEYDGAYAYLDYDDSIGKRRRAVCAQCVHQESLDTDVARAEEYAGSFDEASYDELVESIHEHYEDAHEAVPSEVETGASLLSGTTIGGNTAWHAGNDGTGSGLDADQLDGSDSSAYAIPSGSIMIWSGSIASIPSGWVLCDGNNGTPNLQDRFVAGAGGTYAVDATGGSDTHTLTESELAAHTHTFSGAVNAQADENLSDGGTQNNIDDNKVTQSTGGNSAHENRPPYYALAYIMKV